MSATQGTEKGGEAGRSIAKLLAARRAAIDKAIKDCGGEYNEDGKQEPVRAVLVLLAREAAGLGFDEGVRYMAANS